jgi:hypothetical protein
MARTMAALDRNLDLADRWTGIFATELDMNKENDDDA